MMFPVLLHALLAEQICFPTLSNLNGEFIPPFELISHLLWKDFFCSVFTMTEACRVMDVLSMSVSYNTS